MIKNILFILISALFVAQCSKTDENINSNRTTVSLEKIEIPANTIDLSELVYNNAVSLWTLDGRLFSGYAISLYPNGNIKQKFGIYQGKKQNEALDWYPDGHLKYSSNYHKGKLHGEKKAWTSDAPHRLISHLNYKMGRAHGIQKKWYATGEIYQILNLNMGKEEGIQQAFRKNGILYANYEAKKGRIFGMKKAALCYDLEDEEVKYNSQ
jgi:antitoxin component YwqK of YwqJK toxin-antitoxin module